MSAGISRVHGYTIAPSQRPSTLSFYNLTVPSANLVSGGTVSPDITAPNGAFDQIFRTALGSFATVALIGTPVYTGGNTVINFAIEDTGILGSVAGQTAPTGLGLGSVETSYGTFTSTFAALAGAVQALGTVNGIALGSVVVNTRVAANSSTTI